MNIPKLKPCPFCGGNAVLIYMSFTEGYRIECIECYSASINDIEKEKAIQRWNTRWKETDRNGKNNKG